MSHSVDVYLKILQERGWDEPDVYGQYMKVQQLIKLVKDLEGAGELSDDRHEMQPTLIGLILTAGGDYKGRTNMANTKIRSHSGIKKIIKYLPSDIKDKLRKSLDVKITKNEVNS